MNKKLILINAKARAGKDTLATYIYKELEQVNRTCLISHNAKAVKDLAYSFYKWDGIKDIKGRQLLIDITEAGYKYDSNFWEKKNLINELDRDVYIIPDFRYLKTYQYYKSKGYNIITVHIERPGFENGLGNIKNDRSEQGFKDLKFDFKIINNTIDDLKEAARKIVSEINFI